MAHPAAHAAHPHPADAGAALAAGDPGHAHDHAGHGHGHGHGHGAAASTPALPQAPAGPSLLMAGAATRLGGVLGLLGLLWLAVAWALGDPA